jgi:hypothetical protein
MIKTLTLVCTIISGTGTFNNTQIILQVDGITILKHTHTDIVSGTYYYDIGDWAELQYPTYSGPQDL